MRRGALAAALAVSACATTDVPAVPARLAAPSTDVRIVINAAVSDMLGRTASVDTSAFRDSDIFVMAGRALSGLDIRSADEVPRETFRLEMTGERCAVVHVESGQSRPLAGVECVPI